MSQESTNKKDHFLNREYDFMKDNKYNPIDIMPSTKTSLFNFLILFRFRLAIYISIEFLLILFGFKWLAIGFGTLFFIAFIGGFLIFKKAEKKMGRMLDVGRDLKVSLFSLLR